MRYWIGRLFCKLGWHNWFEGITVAYCRRGGCNAKYNLLTDYEEDEYDG